MSKNAVAKTEAPESEAEGPRKIPEIDPHLCRIDVAGDTTKSVIVRLPADFIADDLKEPGIWKKVQGDRSLSLRKFDRLTMISFDESYMWIAYVAQAGVSGCTLSTPQRIEMKEQAEAYFSDDNYMIRWGGAGLDIVRRSDNHVMKAGLANEDIALKQLRNLYPRSIG